MSLLRPPEIRNLSEKYFLKVASSVCAPKCAYHSNSAGQHSQDSSSNVFDISTGDEDNGDTSPHKWDKVSDVIYPQYVCMCVCFVCVCVCVSVSMCMCLIMVEDGKGLCVCLCVFSICPHGSVLSHHWEMEIFFLYVSHPIMKEGLASTSR